jgi:DNA polymerase
VAGQHDKTSIMAAGKDIYCDMAAEIYKRPIDKKKDPAERQVGKNSVLGLGFQMGWKKFKLKYAKDQPDEFCENVVQVYRKEWAPLVPQVWYELQDAAVDAVHYRKPQQAYGVEYRLEDGWLTARLPSGRKMWYFNPQPIKKAMPWDDTDIRLAFTYQAMKMGQMKTIDAFGGQLTENVVMGIERDLMTCAMLKCEENGMPVVLEVHDEIVVEPLKVDADEKAFQQIMLDVEPWAKALRIPIAVETWMGDRYRK